MMIALYLVQCLPNEGRLWPLSWNGCLAHCLLSSLNDWLKAVFADKYVIRNNGGLSAFLLMFQSKFVSYCLLAPFNARARVPFPA